MPNGLLLAEIDTDNKDIIKFSDKFPALQEARIEKIKTTKKDNKEVNDNAIE